METYAKWLGEPTPSQVAALEAWGETPRPHILLFGVTLDDDYLYCKVILQTKDVKPGPRTFTLVHPDGSTEQRRIIWDEKQRKGAYQNGYYRREKP